MMAVVIPLTIPIFLIYQFILYYDDNSIIDTLEYFLGSVSYFIINYISQIPIVRFLLDKMTPWPTVRVNNSGSE